MKKLVLAAIAISILAVFLTFSLIGASKEIPEPGKSGGESALNFKTKTTAVCEDVQDSVYCHDEVLVNCGSEQYLLPKAEKAVKCGTIELRVPAVTGSAVFDKNWKDPRIAAE